MLIALKDVTDWYTLGIHVKLKVSTLDRIRNDFRDGQHAMEETLKYWLEQDPGSTIPGSTATWEVLVKTLIIMGENTEAKRIEDNVSHHLLDPNVLLYLNILVFHIVLLCSTLKLSKNKVLMTCSI